MASNRHKIKNQRVLPFTETNIENLEFDFNSITKEEFNEIISTSNLEFDLEIPIGRKRKWTIENLINEIKKYKSLDEFRHKKGYLWEIYKQLVLLEKKNSETSIQVTVEPIELNIKKKLDTIQSDSSTKQISVLEYANKINPSYFRKNRTDPNLPISRHAIMYRINKKLPLPEVISYIRVGKVHVLTVSIDF